MRIGSKHQFQIWIRNKIYHENDNLFKTKPCAFQNNYLFRVYMARQPISPVYTEVHNKNHYFDACASLYSCITASAVLNACKPVGMPAYTITCNKASLNQGNTKKLDSFDIYQ